jgi:hypothetical protein
MREEVGNSRSISSMNMAVLTRDLQNGNGVEEVGLAAAQVSREALLQAVEALPSWTGHLAIIDKGYVNHAHRMKALPFMGIVGVKPAPPSK